MHGFGIGQHHDHLARALCKCPLYCLRHMNFLAPLFGANGIAMQCIYHRISSRRLVAVAGRQKHQYLAVGAVAFQAPFQGWTMHLDMLDCYWLGTGHHVRHVIFGLGQGASRKSGSKAKCKGDASDRGHLSSRTINQTTIDFIKSANKLRSAPGCDRTA